VKTGQRGSFDYLLDGNYENEQDTFIGYSNKFVKFLNILV